MLKTADDQELNSNLLSSSVNPQEEVVILREAMNKLLDQRNAAVDQLLGIYEGSPKLTSKKDNSDYSSIKIANQILQKRNREKSELISVLKNNKEKHSLNLQKTKQVIAKLSKSYTDSLRKNRRDPDLISFSVLEKSSDREQYFSKSYLNEKDSNHQTNREVLDQLKQQQQKLRETQNKIRNINKLIYKIEEKVNLDPYFDVQKTILQIVLFGFQQREHLQTSDYYKLCKKYIIKQQPISEQQIRVSGLIDYSEALKTIIYGESIESVWLKSDIKSTYELKKIIDGKGLLQIITQLKNFNAVESEKYSKLQKDRKKFIEKFVKETQELGKSWDNLKNEKQLFQIQKSQVRKEQLEAHHKYQLQLKKKYKIVEEEEKQKIVNYKNMREKLQKQVEKLNQLLIGTQQKLSRKFMQLEQFEAHFNQFILQKEHIKSLQLEINEVTLCLKDEKQKLQQLQNKVNKLHLQEGILNNKVVKLESQLEQGNRQMKELQNKKLQTSKAVQKLREQRQREEENLTEMFNNITKKQQEAKDFNKMAKRAHKNYSLMQQKIKNIEHIEQNKKAVIKQLQQQTKILKQDKENLLQQLQKIQKSIQIKQNELAKNQFKIQQSKNSIQTLADLNKSISDMMLRQSQLKRSIMELQIQNRNLTEIKNQLLTDNRIKNYV